MDINTKKVWMIFEKALLNIQKNLRGTNKLNKLFNKLEIVNTNDILKLELSPDNPPNEKLYDHQVSVRKFYLSREKLLIFFDQYWRKNHIDEADQLQMCELFFLHEFSHIPQKVDSNTVGYSNNEESLFQPLDYFADAFAVSGCYLLNRKPDEYWTKTLCKVLRNHIHGGEIFSLVENNVNIKKMNIERFNRQLIWYFQYARAYAFPPEKHFEEFGLMNQVKFELFQIITSGLSDNLLEKNNIEFQDVNCPIELHICIIENMGKRNRYSITSSEYFNSFSKAVFECNFDHAYEAFRPCFDQFPELIGRSNILVQENHQPPKVSISTHLIPKIKRNHTDLDKNNFIKEAFETIKQYFESGLVQLQTEYPQDVQAKLEASTSNFISWSIYFQGFLKNQGVIWVEPTKFPAIKYCQGHITPGNSCNEWISLEEVNGELVLKPIIGLQGAKNLKIERIGEYLWNKAISSLD